MNDSLDQIKLSFSTHAEAYLKRFGADRRIQKGLNVLTHHFLPSTQRAEDWGCGPGHWSEALLKALPQMSVTGYDLAEGMVELAAKLNPLATFRVANVHELQVVPQSLDVLLMGYLIPYFQESELASLFARGERALAPGGRLLLTYMSEEPVRTQMQASSDGRFHIRISHHSARFVHELLKTQGLSLLFEDVREEKAHQDRVEVWEKPLSARQITPSPKR